MQKNQRTVVEIEYCSDCGWLPRAGWMAQELLQTFEAEGLAVTLLPGQNGVFNVRCGFDLIFSRAAAGHLPDPAEIKKALRERLMPVLQPMEVKRRVA